MKKRKLAIFMFVLVSILLLRGANIRAATLKSPSEYIKSIKYEMFNFSRKLVVIIIGNDDYYADKSLKLQINMYQYNGKLFCTKTFHPIHYLNAMPKRVIKQGKKVYYFKVRLLSGNQPVTTWTKPIYVFRCAKKYIKVKVSNVTAKSATFRISTPKVKGIKKYEVVLDRWNLKRIKKTVKAGKTAVFKNKKIIFGNSDIWGANAFSELYLRPVFKKKSDVLAKYKYRRIPIDDYDENPRREIRILPNY